LPEEKKDYPKTVLGEKKEFSKIDPTEKIDVTKNIFEGKKDI
jgi:hypothetical protein